MCSVSVAKTFVHPESAADYGYYAFGEVTHFVYCLLQKIKKRRVLLLAEQWEEYMAPNHSKFAAIEEDRFFEGTRVLLSLEKMGSPYLKKEFRRDCRKFLEEFVNCIVNCCRDVCNGPRVELFVPSFSGQWRRSCSHATIRHVA